MIELDGTDSKSYLGANAILAVSIACLRGGAQARQIAVPGHVAALCDRPLEGPFVLPMPLVNLINGGRHAYGASDIQEYLVVPAGAPGMVAAVRWSAEIHHHLQILIQDRGWPTTVGEEGGFAPPVDSNEEPLQLFTTAIQEAGYTPGEEDWDGFDLLRRKTGNQIEIVGDDLFATNPARVRLGLARQATNSVLIKPDQIGTITETLRLDWRPRRGYTPGGRGMSLGWWMADQGVRPAPGGPALWAHGPGSCHASCLAWGQGSEETIGLQR
jgi:enolase